MRGAPEGLWARGRPGPRLRPGRAEPSCADAPPGAHGWGRPASAIPVVHCCAALERADEPDFALRCVRYEAPLVVRMWA